MTAVFGHTEDDTKNFLILCKSCSFLVNKSFPSCLKNDLITAKLRPMFDVKETDFFDIEDESFDTVLEPGIKFTGSIKFAKPFMIRGTVNGTINASSDLVIDSGAEVNADIRAVRVLVKGRVRGNITANGLIFVTATGTLDGDITASEVVLEPGSTFSGRCTMTKAGR